MILDTGICSVYKITNTSPAGSKPNESLVKIAEHWFGDLSFESSPIQYTDSLEQVEISRKIRILQNKSITQKAVVVIGSEQYKVERVYHGTDSPKQYKRSMDDSGEPITDLSLSRVVNAYAVV